MSSWSEIVDFSQPLTESGGGDRQSDGEPSSNDRIDTHRVNGHELATNAAKYGALSREAGTVQVDWSTDATALTLKWKERGGPIVTGAPLAVGFGSRLVADTVTGNLSGTQHYDWRPEGVEITLNVPLERLKV